MKLSTPTHDLIASFDVWKHVHTDTYADVSIYYITCIILKYSIDLKERLIWNDEIKHLQGLCYNPMDNNITLNIYVSSYWYKCALCKCIYVCMYDHRDI